MTFLIMALVESVLMSGVLCSQGDPGNRPKIRTESSPQVVIDSAELARFVDPLVSAQMTKEQIPGAVFILVQNGRVLYQRGYGFANLSNQKPVDPEKTIWRIGSISKVFTATAAVQLADRGKYKLTDDVNRYLRKFKVPATFPEPVRFEHLLTHTAGFDEIRPGTRADTEAELLPLGDFLATKLIRLRPPGRVISYSTYGMTLAGHIVEQVSGLDFETYMTRNIWRPLGMTRTNIVVPDSLKRDLAQGYELDSGVNKPATWEWYHTTPASSINGSAADMGRFMIAHLQNGRYGNARILSESAARDMHRQHATSHPKLAGFAYGFYEDFTNGERILQHGGNVEGFSAQMTLLPEHGVGFFIATQARAGEAEGRDSTGAPRPLLPGEGKATARGADGRLSRASATFCGDVRAQPVLSLMRRRSQGVLSHRSESELGRFNLDHGRSRTAGGSLAVVFSEAKWKRRCTCLSRRVIGAHHPGCRRCVDRL